ncbi:hypothetical protein COO91_06130 [Nostoc flagelliforme CCNUN1]|uniref:Uncharacterized protein n=1 Tax=Nostoc flagelliforme CCNUN1 TaxID=2038116 RepID=A0A2K8SXF3_9NOSO|nr:hypothetical protein COO91_06130 [Nostoc flagelliforme CCNUN1]
MNEARNNSVFDFHLYVCIFYKIPTEININYKKLHLLGSGEWGMSEQGDKGTRGQEVRT